MSTAGVQAVLSDLVTEPNSEAKFKADRAQYLSGFDLTDDERQIFATLDVDCLKETAEFLSKFSDAELAVGSIWIKDAG